MADRKANTAAAAVRARPATSVTERYEARTPTSQREWERFGRHLPEGNTRGAAFFAPHPVVLARGEGPVVVDVDGNRYYDLLNNYTSLVHGNAHPQLVEAARSVIGGGTVFPSPHRLQADHAGLLCERLPNAEMVRYTNSGSEAAMMAVRIARAATGRDLVAKARLRLSRELGRALGERRGGRPGAERPRRARSAPRRARPRPRLRFQRSRDLTRVCEAAGSDLAAVIIEPLLGSGGRVPGTPEFFALARELADRTGAVLILDEVQTFRLATGGYQQKLECLPDLTTLGKLIGGGFPIGAVAGSKELLELFRTDSPRHLKHSGTYNGNLVSMAAGLRAVELLTEQEITRINEAGTMLADTAAKSMAECGLAGSVTGYGSMFNIHLGDGVRSVETGTDVLGEDPRLMRLLHLAS